MANKHKDMVNIDRNQENAKSTTNTFNLFGKNNKLENTKY